MTPISATDADRPRTAVLPLFYGRHDVVRGCLEPLLEADRGAFDLYAIENPGPQSTENRALLNEAMTAGRVSGLYLPERNAAFNALLIALARDLFALEDRYEYLVLSDGDVAVSGRSPFDEQLGLMQAHPEISSCSLRIDIRRWNTASKHFLSAVKYAEAAISAETLGRPYAITAGGFWMRMFRTREILSLARVFDRNGVRLRDSTIDQYFRTRGQFPACTIRTLAVELPHGPLFEPTDKTKSLAYRQFRRAGEPDPFSNSLSPGGEVCWPDRVQPLSPEQAVLTVTGTAETSDDDRLAAAIATASAAGWTRAAVCAVLPETPPAPVVLMHAPYLGRVLSAEDGRSVMLPLGALAQATAVEPFLSEIAFDARPPTRWSKRLPALLMQVAARALRPGGALTITTLDWTRAARELAAGLEVVETAAGDQPRLRALGPRALKRGRMFLDMPTLFEPGELIFHATEAGLEVIAFERPDDGSSALQVHVRKPGSAGEAPGADLPASASVERSSPLGGLYKRLVKGG